MEKYHKIKTVHLRDEDTHKLTNKFRDENVEYLKDLDWVFTEKIDGTNIRIYWDGHKIEFAGRTDNAQIPKQLNERLQNIFKNDEMEEMFEQLFNDKEVYLYGEGYGIKIQNGGDYLDHQDLILFDAKVNNIFLDREQLNALSNSLGLKSVPTIENLSSIDDAIKYIKTNPKSYIGTANMEGVVGTPKIPLLNKFGERIIIKIKCKDYNNK